MAKAMISPQELELARKLATAWHLSVSERQQIPPGGLALSALVQAIGEELAAAGWYPRGWRPEQGFDGIVIERGANEYRLHERFEIGVSHYSPCASRIAATLPEAAMAWLRRMFGDQIDGVRIDPKR